MPCYCNIPSEYDQIEIERKCKVRMYFEVQGILTKEQAIECEKRKLKVFPLGDVNECLCKICKILTDVQMKKISAYNYNIKWQHETLYDWHLQHCKDDIQNN